MAFLQDCSITIINQQILGDRYRALTAKLFDDTPAPLTSMGGFDQKAVDQFDVSQIKDLVVRATLTNYDDDIVGRSLPFGLA